MAGYVKLHRSIEGHWVFADDSMFYLFTNLILRANWKQGKVWMGGNAAPIAVERGQLLTGRNSLHRLLYPTHDKHGNKIKRERPPPHPVTLWRWLEALAKDGMVSLDVRSKYTIVTICNYDTYQGPDDGSAQETRKRRASGAQDVRRSCADDAPLMRTIEEGKEGKEGEEDSIVVYDTAEVLAAWNATPGVLQARRIVGKRQTHLAARLRDSAWDWRAALAKFPLKCFSGEPDGWRPNIDWFLRPDTVTAILEGKYDWSKANGKSNPVGPGQRYDGT